MDKFIEIVTNPNSFKTYQFVGIASNLTAKSGKVDESYKRYIKEIRDNQINKK